MVEDRGLSKVVAFLIPTPDQHPWTPPDGYLCLYESFFTFFELWFPLPKLLTHYCFYRDISVSQLTHAAVRNIVSVLTLAAKAGSDINRRYFEEMSQIKRDLNLSGRFYISMWSEYNL